MKLPPLNALRAFDAAARMGGIKAAAQELSVTPAAVSQQVRALEDYLGCALFDRLPRELRLTSNGYAYHQTIGRHLRGISEATERLRPKRQSVSISVVPSFATLWLSPRLPRFIEQHPLIEIRIEAESELIDFRTSGFDIAIREMPGTYRDTEAAMLFGLDLLPVASPAYVKSLTQRGQFDWSRARLLHEGSNEYWDTWLDTRGLRADTAKGFYFSHGMMALAAAAEGEGIALTAYCLVERSIKDRRLVMVDTTAVATGRGYWLAWPRASVGTLSESAQLFRDWVLAQAKLTAASAPSTTAPAAPAAAVVRRRAAPKSA
jgi:LysR family transcriptional regulator, glycine cleavage system transcriptional activator